jgi:ribose 5-phosphate isomerase A
MDPAANEFRPIAERALEIIGDGSVIGLGTGHAATAFLYALAERVQSGLRVHGVPTSEASAQLARELGIPLTTFAKHPVLDVDVDGADEVDPQNNLIKGYGGALVREKIVARAARRLVILVGPEKIVTKLGSRGILPVEVIPFGLTLAMRELSALHSVPQLRLHEGQPWVTDNGNFILDCQIAPLDRPAELEQTIRAIPGILGTGLFLDMKPTVLVQHGDRIEER